MDDMQEWSLNKLTNRKLTPEQILVLYHKMAALIGHAVPLALVASLVIPTSAYFLLHPCHAGTNRRRHEEHQPRRHGGRSGRRRSGWLQRRRCGVGARRRERPRGGARFPQSRSSGPALHEQNWRTGSVLHGHVTETETADWTVRSLFSLFWAVCLLAGEKQKR